MLCSLIWVLWRESVTTDGQMLSAPCLPPGRSSGEKPAPPLPSSGTEGCARQGSLGCERHRAGPTPAGPDVCPGLVISGFCELSVPQTAGPVLTSRPLDTLLSLPGTLSSLPSTQLSLLPGLSHDIHPSSHIIVCGIPSCIPPGSEVGR